MATNKNTTIGFDALLPLTQGVEDLFYELHRTIKGNIQQNLKMLLYTSPGERIMVPDYGVGLKRFLFEQFPDFEIDAKIREQVKKYLPQITIMSLSISRDNRKIEIKSGHPNSLAIELIYEINQYNLRDSLIVVDTLTEV